ncbi:MAG TPA: response regulator [Nitrososphaeraceae archaeon]
MMAKIENNTSNTKKVMIVDDEADVISVLGIVLEENGFEVDTFEDPIVALKSYRAGVYDLLILDIKMPEMDGFELYDQIKKIDDNAKVCFLTASEMYYKNSRKEKYCSLDKDLFIQKPIANEDLVEEINKILSRV